LPVVPWHIFVWNMIQHIKRKENISLIMQFAINLADTK
jgi:hypothetical protein